MTVREELYHESITYFQTSKSFLSWITSFFTTNESGLGVLSYNGYYNLVKLTYEDNRIVHMAYSKAGGHVRPFRLTLNLTGINKMLTVEFLSLLELKHVGVIKTMLPYIDQEDKNTLLWYAIESANYHVSKFLIENGVRCNVTEEVITYLKKKGSFKLVKLLT
jgi:hypothetical protein